MPNNRRGRMPKELARLECTWENALALIIAEADFTELARDCDELYIRFQQMLHRYPEREELIVPGMERAENMRSRILRLQDDCEQAREKFVRWKEQFDK
jgi:hypothetical protein